MQYTDTLLMREVWGHMYLLLHPAWMHNVLGTWIACVFRQVLPGGFGKLGPMFWASPTGVPHATEHNAKQGWAAIVEI